MAWTLELVPSTGSNWTSESVPSTGSNWTAETASSFIGWATEVTQTSSWKHTGHFGWVITSTEPGSITHNISFTITITFDEPVIDFDLTDFSTINCVISNLAGSGKVYTATCTKSYFGQITVAILDSRVTDDKGHKNSIGTLFSINVQPFSNTFISSWTLSGPQRTITLPLISGGNYNFDIDWGDGTLSTVTSWNQVIDEGGVAMTHTYSTNGVKDIEMGGASNYLLAGWRFANGGDRNKIRDISDWGPLEITENSAFYGCTVLNVTASNVPSISSADLGRTFSNCEALDHIGGNWDVSGVTNTGRMFAYCLEFNGDVTSWDVSSVTDMRGTFQQCPKFNRDIGDWETGNVENMQYMFDYASIFNQDINTDGAKWNMGKCEDLQNMFSYALAFEQNLEDWDIKSVTTAEDMFLGVNLSTPNYNALLVGWEDNDHLDDVIFHGGTSKYTYPSSASIARAALEGDGWDITDGGASFPA